MRSVKSASVFVALAVGSCVVVACSADGNVPDVGPAGDSGGLMLPGADTGTTPPNDMDSGEFPDDATLPPVDAGKDAKVQDTGAKDTGINDTGAVDARDAQVIEAGGDAGPTGTACPTKDAVQQQTCGFCGFQTRVCEPNGGDAAAPNVWQPWGFCQAEVANGCAPGTMANEACGLCGTRQKICQNDCNFAVGSCTGQPANACAPGSTDFEVGLSCDAGGRSRTCKADCTYNSFGACFTPDGGITGASLTVPAVAGGTAKGQFTMAQTQTIARLGAFDTCPGGTISATISTYQYVALVNTTSKTANVSVWQGKSTNAGSVDLDTIMAAYTGSGGPPVTPAQRQACSVGVNDSCGDNVDPTSCLSGWAGLMLGDATQVTIGPFATAYIYNACYFASTSTLPHAGDFQLTVRTDTIN